LQNRLGERREGAVTGRFRGDFRESRAPRTAEKLWEQSRLVTGRSTPILAKSADYFSLSLALAASPRGDLSPTSRRKTLVETTSAPVPAAIDRPSFLVRHQFVIYRLFSLAGLIPVGAYMVVHLLTNASVINGAAAFQENVDRIHSLGKALVIAEWAFIFIPITFHAVVGWLIIAGAVPNAGSYSYASNLRYTAQRATGIIAFVFIVFHVIQLHHFFGAPFKEVGDMKLGAQFDPAHAASSAAVALHPLWVKLIYLVGMLSAIYHFSNGLWTQGITWGIWTSAAAQRRASWVSVLVGLILTVVGLTALFGFSFVDVDRAKEVENAMQAQRQQILELEHPVTTDGAAADGEAPAAAH
jgi:succinate dehydrogenase / fumarate reductase cytochrome b subunit